MIQCPNCNETVADSYDMCPNCGLDLVEHGVSHSDLTGKIIQDKYKVIEKIGQGGMGVVYKVEHKLTGGKFFALKLVHPHLSQDPMVKKRFLREVKMALEFVHENAVQIRDFGQLDSGELYFTMDYIEGQSIKQTLKEQQSLTPHRAIQIAMQVLRALGKGHERGIVHRDIKPDNILIARDHRGRDVAQVLDFGIAKAFEGDGGNLTQAGGIVGTPKYMSPEQIQGKAVDNLTDLYSVGVVLYEMITGRVPFEGENTTAIMLKHISAQPTSPRKLCPNLNLPLELEQIILKALSKNRDTRFQSADQFIQALLELPAESLGSTTDDTIAASTTQGVTRSYDDEDYTLPADETRSINKEGTSPAYMTVTVSKSSQVLQYVLAFTIVFLILGAIGGGIFLLKTYRDQNIKEKEKVAQQKIKQATELEKEKNWIELEKKYMEIANYFENELSDSKESDSFRHKAKQVKSKKIEQEIYEKLLQLIKEKEYALALKTVDENAISERITGLKSKIRNLERADKVDGLIQTGEYEAAVKILEEVVREIKDEKWKVLLGQARDCRDNKAKMDTFVKEALEAQKNKEWKKARDLYKNAQTTGEKLPNKPSYYNIITTIEKHMEDDTAFARMKKRVEIATTTESIEDAIEKAKKYYLKYKDHNAEAEKIIEDLKKKLDTVRGKEYGAKVERAKNLFAAGELGKAQRESEEASKLMGGRSEAFELLGKIHIKKQEWKEALKNLERAQQNGAIPEKEEWIEVYFQLKRHSEAFSILKTIFTETPKIIYWKAQISEALSDKPNAYQNYVKLIKAEPGKHPEAYRFLGEYAANYVSNEKSVEYYLKFLEITEAEAVKYSQEIAKVQKQILDLAEYIPLTVGKSMNYQRTKSNQSVTIATYSITSATNGIYTREITWDENKTQDQIQKKDGYLVVTTSRGIEQLLKISPTVGDEWTFDKNTKAKILGLENLQVGSQKFYNCLRVKYTTTTPAATLQREMWYAPNVGVVKNVLKRKLSGASNFELFYEEILK